MFNGMISFNLIIIKNCYAIMETNYVLLYDKMYYLAVYCFVCYCRSL